MKTCNQHHILFEQIPNGDWQARDTVCGEGLWYCCKEHWEQGVTPNTEVRYTTVADDVIQND